jgi:hypothetical protein
MRALTKRSFTAYFRGYRAVLAANAAGDAESLRRFSDFFLRFRHDIPRLQKNRLENERSRAPRFNIFRVLPIERRETLLHSPLLANLLNPTASHGQGCLFLRTFLAVASENVQLIPPSEPLEPDEWSVRSEVYIGNGTIDLLLECPKQGYVIVIENKIDASEQEAQLSRYHRWLRERRAKCSTRQLVFLTPTGRASELSPKIPCILMSYHRDILEFLNRSIPTLEPPHLKVLLTEYQSVLNDWAQEINHEHLTE